MSRMWRKVSGLLIAAALLLPSVSAVLAQQNDQPSSGLRISPTRTELSLDKGKSTNIKIFLKNVSGGDITAQAEINDFESEGETGEPRILIDNPEPTSTSIKKFISGLGDVKLKKDQTKEINIKAAIPKDFPSGAYYGVIRYSAIPGGGQSEPGKLSLTASVATLVLIEVPGNITEQIQLNDILVYDGEKSGSFFFNPPTQAGIRITNTGTGFSKPFGRVTVNRTLGGNEVYGYELNNTTPRNNILPDTTRVFRDDIKNINMPGRYTIAAGVSHGTNGEVLSKTVSFWYIPVWLAVILVLLLVAVIVGIYLLIRKYRKSSRVHRRSR